MAAGPTDPSGAAGAPAPEPAEPPVAFPSADALAATDRIDTGRSEVLQGIAKKWGLPIRAVNAEIDDRARFMELAAAGPMEAAAYAKCASAYRAFREKNGGGAAEAWEQWLGKVAARGG
jgi:hypothetical protein